MNWTLTPDEFAFVWRETGLDRFPSPLAIVTTARTEDAAAHQEEAARRRYPHRENPELSVALRVSAHPSTHIKIVADSMRMAGCALNGTAAVIVQADSMIRVSLIREAVLTETLAEAVPEATAGSKPAMSASAARLRGDGRTDVLADPSRPCVLGPMRALLSARRSGEGHVAVHRFADNEFPPKPRFVSWIDVAGDGRYLVRDGTDVDIVPATRHDVRAELDRLVARRRRQ